MNVLIVSFLTLLSLAFGGLFYWDMRGGFEERPITVATLQAASGSVKRLARAGLVWDHAEAGTHFGAGDSISTSEQSQAVVRFLNPPSEIQMEEGSLFTIGKVGEEIQLNFLAGRAQVRVEKKSRGSGGIRVVPAVTTAKVELKEVEKLPAPKPEVDMGRAPAAVTPSVKEEAIRNPDEVLNTGGQAAKTFATLEDVQLQMVYPAKDTTTMAQRSVTFLWETRSEFTLPRALSYALEIQREGEAEARVFKTNQKRWRAESLEPGKYTWSVRPIDASGRLGPVAEMRTLTIEEPAEEIPTASPRVLPVSLE